MCPWRRDVHSWASTTGDHKRRGSQLMVPQHMAWRLQMNSLRWLLVGIVCEVWAPYAVSKSLKGARLSLLPVLHSVNFTGQPCCFACLPVIAAIVTFTPGEQGGLLQSPVADYMTFTQANQGGLLQSPAVAASSLLCKGARRQVLCLLLCLCCASWSMLVIIFGL